MDQTEAMEAATGSGEMSATEFMVRVSYRYHKKRERFFRLLDAASKALSLVALTAFATFGGWPSAALAVVSGAATIGAIVLDFSGMAAKHEALAGRFMRLLSRIVAGGLSEKESIARLAKIEATEPNTLRGLAQICQDEVDASRGAFVEPERLSNLRRLKAHFGYGEMPITWDSDQSHQSS